MRESRVKKATRNIFSSVFQMCINLIINFVGRIVFIRILDASYLGINGLFTNILSILSMADLGMTTAMMFHLYKPIADNDHRKICNLVGYFKRIYIIIATAVFLIGMSLVPFLKYIINLEQDIPYVQVYYVLALLNVVISYLFVYRTTLIAADQKNYLLNKTIIIFKIITFFAQIIVLVLFGNYFLYLLVAVALSFICNLYQNQIALKLYPYLNSNEYYLDKIEQKGIFNDIKSLFIYKIAGVLQTNIQSILISIFTGTVFVGYYSNYLMIVNQIVNVLTLIFNNLKASIGNVIADENSKFEQKWFLYKVFDLFNYWSVAFCSICLLVLFNDFVYLCFGKKYVLDIVTVIEIILNFYTNNNRQNIWAFRETTGIFVQTKHIVVVTTLLTVIGSIVLGYNFGIKGILFATIIARMLYAWWKEPQILFREVFHRGAKEYYLTYIQQVVLLVIIGSLTYLIANIISFPSMYIAFIYKMLICLLFPNICFIFLYFQTEEFKYLYNKILRK